MTIALPITTELVAACSLCKRKAFLLMRNESGEPDHEYVRLVGGHAAASLKTFLASLEANGRVVRQCVGTDEIGKGDVLAQVLLKSDGVEATADVLIPLGQS